MEERHLSRQTLFHLALRAVHTLEMHSCFLGSSCLLDHSKEDGKVSLLLSVHLPFPAVHVNAGCASSGPVLDGPLE